MMPLGLYSGIISHHRTQPREHRFDYKMMHVCLDLQQVSLLDKISRFWSSKSRNLVRFQDRNYFTDEGSSDADLYQRVCEKIHASTGKTFNGKAYLLANLSYWGHCYNPVVFVCCYENDELCYLIAEVHNTPWGERFAYVHDVKAQTKSQDEAGFYHADFDKSFHVSPFMPMDLQYHWTYKVSDSHFFYGYEFTRKRHVYIQCNTRL